MEVVTGAPVLSENGRARRFSAVDQNTFRGFYRVRKNCPGAKEAFRKFFLDEKPNLIEALRNLRTEEELHHLENCICESIRGRLDNVRSEQLRAYNKIRKPVDLYVMNLVAMATDLDSQRATLTPLLFLPLDSQILQHPELFTDRELREYGLSRRATYKDVTSERTYMALQRLLMDKARVVSDTLGTAFHRIYFDLLWNDRYIRWGGNLFETNP